MRSFSYFWIEYDLFCYDAHFMLCFNQCIYDNAFAATR